MKAILVSEAMDRFKLTYEQVATFKRCPTGDGRARVSEQSVCERVVGKGPWLTPATAEILQWFRVRRNCREATVPSAARALRYSIWTIRKTICRLKRSGLLEVAGRIRVCTGGHPTEILRATTEG